MVCLAITLISCSKTEGEITIYKVWCNDSFPLEDCWDAPVLPIPLNPTTYRVSEERQSVIYWSSSDGSPSGLSDCVVRDVKNWKCTYPDGWGTLYMDDGLLNTVFPSDYPSPHGAKLEKYHQQVSRTKYWTTRLRWWMN